MHEDHPTLGKGHNDAFMLQDFERLDWFGANSFRTSHYPYSEDVLDYADRRGIVVTPVPPAVHPVRVQSAPTECAPHQPGQQVAAGLALINTSFDLRGQPIVRTPADAVQTWARSAIDALGVILVIRPADR
jgi:hypothetical protein